jgi:hypothetical protein
MPQATNHISTHTPARKAPKKSTGKRAPRQYSSFKAFPGMTPQEMVASASLAKFDPTVRAAFAELCRRETDFTDRDFSKEIDAVGQLTEDFRNAARVFREVAKMIDNAMAQKRRIFLRFAVRL